MEQRPDPFEVVSTLNPSTGRLDLDDPARYREWLQSQGDLVQGGKSGPRFVISIEEQWSSEARKFYFQILKMLRDAGDMAGWTHAEQHAYYKQEFNEGRSIQYLGKAAFDEFLDSVILDAALRGVAVPEPNRRHRWEGRGL